MGTGHILFATQEELFEKILPSSDKDGTALALQALYLFKHPDSGKVITAILNVVHREPYAVAEHINFSFPSSSFTLSRTKDGTWTPEKSEVKFARESAFIDPSAVIKHHELALEKLREVGFTI